MKSSAPAFFSQSYIPIFLNEKKLLKLGRMRNFTGKIVAAVNIHTRIIGRHS